MSEKRILGPKHVKKANGYCVTVFELTKGGKNQTVSWFSTLEEAEAFKKKQQES